jgi:hypothetical protein
LLQKNSCVVFAPKEVKLTIIRAGNNPVSVLSVNGVPPAKKDGGKDWFYLKLPAGTHTIEYSTD